MALGVYHSWSHAEAYAHTARQTQALIGWNWGGGLYINYGFSALWVGEVVWWWASPKTYQRRARALNVLIRGFFLFMIVNGAIVFVDGPLRWLGVAIVAALLVGWAVEARAPKEKRYAT